MDRLTISGLKVETIIGTNPWERETRQPIIVDLEMQVDSLPAARSDNIGDAVDYGAIGRRVRNLVSDSRFQLIEGIAERIANDVLQQESRVISVTVCVTKPYAIPDASVSLTITRPRRPVSQT